MVSGFDLSGDIIFHRKHDNKGCLINKDKIYLFFNILVHKYVSMKTFCLVMGKIDREETYFAKKIFCTILIRWFYNELIMLYIVR